MRVTLHYNFNKENFRDGAEFFSVTYDDFQYEIELTKEEESMCIIDVAKNHWYEALELAAYKLMNE